jgi:hypothetical protein
LDQINQHHAINAQQYAAALAALGIPANAAPAAAAPAAPPGGQQLALPAPPIPAAQQASSSSDQPVRQNPPARRPAPQPAESGGSSPSSGAAPFNNQQLVLDIRGARGLAPQRLANPAQGHAAVPGQPLPAAHQALGSAALSQHLGNPIRNAGGPSAARAGVAPPVLGRRQRDGELQQPIPNAIQRDDELADDGDSRAARRLAAENAAAGPSAPPAPQAGPQ